MRDVYPVRQLQTVLESGREHPRILDEQQTLVAVLLNMVRPSRRAAQSHDPCNPIPFGNPRSRCSGAEVF